MGDPVFYDCSEEAWFFWDETWADRIGPFESEAICRYELQRYIEAFL